MILRTLSVTTTTTTSDKDLPEVGGGKKPVVFVPDTFSKAVIITSNNGPGSVPNDDYTGHYERNFITALRAMKDFQLKPEHLEGLRVNTRRSPHEVDPPIKVYWRKDVEARSIQVWGSSEALEAEHERLEAAAKADEKELVSFYRRLIKHERTKDKKKYARENWPVRALRPTSSKDQKEGLNSASGKVVLTAIGINSANCFFKGLAWTFTGSHVMFSEMIHSAADTMNQVNF
jgi:zinc transporter 9